MKKWKFLLNKSKKKSPDKEDEDKKDIPKEVGLFQDFLVFDNNETSDFEFKVCNFDDPNIKDWLILQYSSNKTKSRFSSLFEEIIENDKKLALEEKSDKNERNKKENGNIIINDIDKNNNININNEDDKNSNMNIINNEKENIININNDIKNNNIIIEADEKDKNIIIEENENDKNIFNFNNINKINYIRNDSDLYPQNRDSNISSNNYFQDKKPQEFPNSYSNQINIPFIGPHSYEQKNSLQNSYSGLNEHKKSTYSHYSGPYEHKKSLQSNHSGPYEHKKSFYSNYSGPYEHKKSLYSNYSGPYEHKKSIYSNYSGTYEHKKSIYSNSSGNYAPSTNESEFNCSNRNTIFDRNSIFETRPQEKKFELNVDIKKVINLEDRRTTVMIKNIPNKFTRDLLLSIIDQHFKGAYDLFILPTDVNRYKNFGYSFINFTCSYYIPYFYFLFNGKKWSNTNSEKICEITYSKIQGRTNLLSHYPNKIIFRNDESKKYIIDQKFIIPNGYRKIFNKCFPNFPVEEFDYYFKTKMPFKY